MSLRKEVSENSVSIPGEVSMDSVSIPGKISGDSSVSISRMFLRKKVPEGSISIPGAADFFIRCGHDKKDKKLKFWIVDISDYTESVQELSKEGLKLATFKISKRGHVEVIVITQKGKEETYLFNLIIDKTSGKARLEQTEQFMPAVLYENNTEDDRGFLESCWCCFFCLSSGERSSRGESPLVLDEAERRKELRESLTPRKSGLDKPWPIINNSM